MVSDHEIAKTAAAMLEGDAVTASIGAKLKHVARHSRHGTGVKNSI